MPDIARPRADAALPRLALASLALALPPVAPALAESPMQHADVEITGSVLEPRQLEPTEERLAGLSLPPGFEIRVFAENLINPRMLAATEQGLYVTRRAVGDVVLLRDADGDGRAEERRIVANRPQMHGIWIEGDTAWLATVEDIYRADIQEDGGLGDLERIVDDLPDGGQHPNRTLAIGPDGKLYVSVGSTCNACGETDQESATLLQLEPDGSSRRIFASGLRNTIGFGWHPATGTLWGMDHGIDWLGDQEQVEELNRLEQGKKYGWPYVYGDGKHNPQDEPPGGITLEQWAETSEAPVLGYTAHAAPMQLAFYDGEAFPAGYRGDAFVAMRGSWNRRPPSGYEVLRIDFDETGEPQGFESFVTGFLVENEEGWGHLGRLAGLAVGPEGALYLSDDTNGVVYRIAYTGEREAEASEAASGSAPAASPRKAELEAGSDRSGSDETQRLAIDLLAPQREQALQVTSPAFEADRPIPPRFAAEGENISPPLAWQGAPEGTRAFVVLVEDPAVERDPPFVHWILANVPAEVTELAQGVPGAPKLRLPEDALQGVNSKGSTGWTGMHPPADDPPHPYHVQVFALDGKLDLPPGAGRTEVLAAMEGRVLAAGQLVGTYGR